ncbi:hypothetical protein BLNAU_227 [Blattamonas nauphoetae]|uniref:Uncharacterized protein n=1 Tax=Blattamonas nauphoetae TaxID=2049346 RepID=A0ABQ9YML8_9EUKA|nr:hypothetical protein BLNAU_227 [Blattamonas nauphoetae]
MTHTLSFWRCHKGRSPLESPILLQSSVHPTTLTQPSSGTSELSFRGCQRKVKSVQISIAGVKCSSLPRISLLSSKPEQPRSCKQTLFHSLFKTQTNIGNGQDIPIQTYCLRHCIVVWLHP